MPSAAWSERTTVVRSAAREPCGPCDVRREIVVAEPEPVLFAVLGQ